MNRAEINEIFFIFVFSDQKGNGAFLGEKTPCKGCHCHAKELLGGVRLRLGSNDKKR